MKICTYILFLLTIGVNMAAYPAFYVAPKLFYYRPWEYFREVTFHDKAYPSVWNGEEQSDRTRDNFFIKQEGRATHVTVDEWGYRSVPDISPYPGIVVYGDSQVYGSHLSDDETLPWLLSKRLNVQIVNAADHPRTIMGLLKEPKFKCLQLIVETNVEWIQPVDFIKISREVPEFPKLAPAYSGRIDVFKQADIRRYNASFIIINSLRRIRNDINDLRGPGETYTGAGINKMEEFKLAEATARADYDYVRQHNLKFVYMPVYTKFSVLAPYDIATEKDLEGKPPSSVHSVSFSSVLTSMLRRDGVPAVDFSHQFKALQKEGIVTYNQHDSHWNPKGVEVAEQILENYIRQKGLFDQQSYHACIGQ